MSTFVKKQDREGNNIMVGMARLTSKPNEKWIEYTKGKGTAEEENKRYKLVNIEIVTPSGAKTSMPASLHEKSIERMEESQREFTVGEEYLTTLQRVERNDGQGLITFARISHLQNVVADEAVIDELFADAGDAGAIVNAKAVEAEA